MQYYNIQLISKKYKLSKVRRNNHIKIDALIKMGTLTILGALTRGQRGRLLEGGRQIESLR